jgi:hypothetical protein
LVLSVEASTYWMPKPFSDKEEGSQSSNPPGSLWRWVHRANCCSQSEHRKRENKLQMWGNSIDTGLLQSLFSSSGTDFLTSPKR